MAKKKITRSKFEKSEMTPKQLISKIRKLSHEEIETQKFNKALGIVCPNEDTWYKHQKEHWLGWLREAGGAGAYGRKKGHIVASTVYNRIMCEPMLFWLMEAAGISKSKLKEVRKVAILAKHDCAVRCPAMRNAVPWSDIEKALGK